MLLFTANCISVTDFHDSLGTITDFCPEHIVCVYKVGELFANKGLYML